jgi:hypothetical protein
VQFRFGNDLALPLGVMKTLSHRDPETGGRHARLKQFAEKPDLGGI